jgi:hypothetical protein
MRNWKVGTLVSCRHTQCLGIIIEIVGFNHLVQWKGGAQTWTSNPSDLEAICK